MNFYYNGTDIYNDVSVNYCVHEMFAEKQADTLVIRFNDVKGVWSKWQPAAGDTVRFTEGASDTGKMFIHSMKPENGLFTIRAMSMPKTGRIRKSKSWEGVHFLQLANEFAANHGLSFKNYVCTDQLYPYIKQENESDFAMFSRLCTLEGCQMLIFDGSLLAYNEQYIESQQAAASLEIDENGVFYYADNRDAMYGSCEVAGGSYSGTFVADASQRRAKAEGCAPAHQQRRGCPFCKRAPPQCQQIRPHRPVFKGFNDRVCGGKSGNAQHTKGEYVGRHRVCA